MTNTIPPSGGRMKTKLTLDEMLKLSLLQKQEMEDLMSPTRKSAYRRMMRQKIWREMWDDERKSG